MSDTALLVIDMLNSYQHDDAGPLADSVTEIIGPLARLIDRVRNHDDVDLIYVNDNYGDFTATRDGIVRHFWNNSKPMPRLTTVRS